MHRVLFAYASHETVSVVEGYGPMPSACLFEDEYTGRRWLLADAPITLHSWVEAESFGALGMVRTSPLRYVAAEHVAEHREVRAGNVEVPERWWINHTGPLLPSMPLLAAGLIVPKSRFANLHVHSEFCLAPETLVCTSAMEWKKIGDVIEGEELVGFDEDLRPADGQRGNSRSKMQPSTVVATHRRIRDCYRITLEDGTSIISSAQHGWVVTGTTRGSLIEPGGPECGYGMNTRRWLTTERIAERPDRLPRMVRWATPWSDPPPTLQREAAYLAGILDGEGWIHDGQLAVAQNPGAVLDEIKRCCSVLGYPITSDRIQSSKGDCRTFRFAGYETALRVLSQCGPVRFSDRWGEVWVGRRAGGRYTKPVQVVSVEHLGEMETVALTTSTKTFVAEGFLSHNSPLDGLATIEELVDAAVADEQEFISVTDHGYCAAHPQLSKIAKAAGIKPIFGIEANLVNNRFERETETVLRPDGSARQRAHYWHFIMLAMNDVGLRNLWAASSEAHITGFWGRPRMDWSTLERHNDGIIASTACLRGPVASLILSGDIEGAAMMLARLRSIFPDRLYVELHANHLPDQLIVNRALVDLAARLSLPTIVVADSHYACRDEQDLHQVWIAVQTDKDLDDDQELFAGGQHYHVHSTADIESALDYLPGDVVQEAMRNTIEIGRMCTAEIKARTSMPVFHRHDVKGASIGSGVERDVEVLRQKVEEGFAVKVAHKENVAIYRDQVERELDLMVSKGFAGYFLIVDDYCEAARSGRAHPQGKKILMGPGRGSVVGSLVAYLLGITKIDPIEADLMFERFLTPGRTSPPDIDLDFPSSERDSITNYTIGRWGDDRVVRVGTHGRLKNKGVIQKVAKALGSRISVDFMDLKEISRIITAAEAHTAGAGLKWDDLWEQEGDLLEPYRQKYPEVFEVSDKLVKRLASYGRHASGIVIDPEESIVDRLPLRTAGSEKEGRQIVTEFDFEWLEFLGFLKFDFLTLRTLDTIQQCVDLIADDPALPGISIDIDSWVDEYEDPQVWDMLCDGDTLGVFQIETSEGSKLVRRMQPRSIADLSAILTLVRPGPMRSGLTDSYLRRRFGQEEVVAPLPEMEAVLGRTYQCMIYQEDIMGVCQALAGYDLAEADKVRAILGKKKVEEAKKEGRRFVERCKERGLDEATVEHIWSQMEEFAKYTFNRAHAWSYAVLAYWCAWLKCHFPAHFLVAVLSTVDKARIPEFVELARRNGYSVSAPDVNDSRLGFSVSSDRLGVRYGFSSIPDIGTAAANAIIEFQPYSSWDDFVARRGPACNWGHIKKLAAVGTFDSIITPVGQHRAALERLIEQMAEGKAITCVHKRPGHEGPNGLPCTFPWETEVTIGKSGKPLKQRPLPKTCSRACRQYQEQETYVWPRVDPLSDREIRERERSSLGVYLSSTPFDVIKTEALDAEGIIYGFDAESAPAGNHVVFGMVQSIRKHVDRSGNEMAFVRINSRGYELDLTCFSKTWFQVEHIVKRDVLALCEINRNARGSTLTNFYPIPV